MLVEEHHEGTTDENMHSLLQGGASRIRSPTP